MSKKLRKKLRSVLDSFYSFLSIWTVLVKFSIALFYHCDFFFQVFWIFWTFLDIFLIVLDFLGLGYY